MTASTESVVFAVSSRDGHVWSLAESAAEAVTRAGLDAPLLRVDAMDDPSSLRPHLEAASAVVFCTPTYVGGPTWEFARFAEWTSSLRPDAVLAGKLAGGITCGFAPEGGKASTLMSLFTLAMQHSMLWVGLPTAAVAGEYDGARVVLNAEGHRVGVGATLQRGELTAGALATAQQLGGRLASLAGASS